MSSLSLDRVPRIVQGAGALEELAGVLAGIASPVVAIRHVLLVADPAMKPLGVLDTAQRALSKAGLGVSVFDGVQSDPSMAQTDATARLARSERAQAVVAIGGGSAMDLGKTVAAIAGAERRRVTTACAPILFPPRGWPASAYRRLRGPVPRRLAPRCSRTTRTARSGCGAMRSRPM